MNFPYKLEFPKHIKVIHLQAVWWYNSLVCFVPDSGIAQTLKKGEVFLYEIGGNIGKHVFFSLYFICRFDIANDYYLYLLGERDISRSEI